MKLIFIQNSETRNKVELRC